jgi:soluble lytic murein transglycosylase-like protein
MLAFVASAPAHAETVVRWRPFIDEASARFGIPAAWIERVMRAESGGQSTLRGRPITSRAGAMGLMQLMPSTWAAMRARLGLDADPHDPRDNILAGTFYLRLMYDRFGYPGLFAAYNAGPGRYAEYLAGRRALPGETRAYLVMVTRGDVSASVAPAAPAPTLFYPPSPVDRAPAGSAIFITLSTTRRP